MAKKKLKTKKTKSYLQKKQECNTLMEQITSLGLTTQEPAIQQLFIIMKNYKDNNVSWSGKLPLVGHKRVMNVILSNKPHVTNTINLIYDPNV